jgi:hypothetical protein
MLPSSSALPRLLHVPKIPPPSPLRKWLSLLQRSPSILKVLPSSSLSFHISSFPFFPLLLLLLYLYISHYGPPLGVIPVLLAGDFPISFPSGYSNVMGCDLRDPVSYTHTLPTLVSKLLGIHLLDDVQKWLKVYEEDTRQLLLQPAVPDMMRVLAQYQQNIK